MARDHWGATIRTPTLGGQRTAPLSRLPDGSDEYVLRAPSDQRRLRAAEEDRASPRQPGRVAGSRREEPSDDGGGVG